MTPTSALDGKGVDEAWAAVEECTAHLRSTGALDRLRAGQAVAWMWDEIRETLLDGFRRDPEVARRWDEVEAAVRNGRLSPTTAARRLLEQADRAQTPQPAASTSVTEPSPPRT